MNDEYLIVSWEHNAFWRANGVGYTQNIAEAGRYSHQRATQIVDAANRYLDDGQFNEVMVKAP